MALLPVVVQESSFT